ncbi:sarcospan isoform X2 [Betta splendens]|uniref:Sarcospan isoform X2 n=1 Tax=Betta splendens TaxID=158456 RepID=A0A6P7MN45_BETSP|nr:sarcospan isoform X2 [Betta splendens]
MGQGRKKGSSDRKEDASPGPEGGAGCRACRFPLLVALLQLLLGASVAAVAFLALAVSPSLLLRETPHWAGILLCVVSVVGFVLYCITYVPDERTSVQFIVKLLYFALCTVGLVVSLLAMAFAAHHHAQTSGLTCEPLGGGCECTLDPDDPIARTFAYEQVEDCGSIPGTLPLYFLVQIVLNLLQALVCAAGAFVMWKHRYQVFFSGLQVGSPSAQQWSKV